MITSRLIRRVRLVIVFAVYYYFLCIINVQHIDRALSKIDYSRIESLSNYPDFIKNVEPFFSTETTSVTRTERENSRNKGYVPEPQRGQRHGHGHDVAEESIAEVTYFDLREKIESLVRNESWTFKTSYQQSTIVDGDGNKREEESPFLNSTKLVCRETCCVQRVWISLNQDDRKLLNWRNDVQELADVMIQQFDNKDASLHATNLYSEDLIPCFVPNTIISVDNFDKSIQYFWQQVRPRIRVPFLLVTGGSDHDSPLFDKKRQPTIPQYIADPLLLKWYGMNPRTEGLKRKNNRDQERFRRYKDSKFRPMLSGLSYLHPQERYLSTYLALTNYTNPFSKHLMEKRFAMSSQQTKNAIDFDRDVFVHFGRKKNPFRQFLWNVLCPNTTTDTTSCGVDTNHKHLHRMYADMTMKGGDMVRRYKFGISPPGMGYDCYRHYEMWYLGMIPVIWDRDPESHYLYKNLPVLQLNKDQKETLKNRQDFASAIQDYVQSTEFYSAMSDGTFERGWNQLFLRSKRRAILNDSDREILVDKSGNEFYPAYRYFLREDVATEGSDMTTMHALMKANDRSIYCHYADENCAVRDGDGADRSVEWVDDTNHEYNLVDQEWMNEWEGISGANFE
mmetsp:Transcript_5802/g.16545  ORF Transcript_5802/g.16545 Transcript_5802/m.16545 type:complete len:621 (-) Transcript_5802:3482-5344(-)